MEEQVERRNTGSTRQSTNGGVVVKVKGVPPIGSTIQNR